MCHAPARKPKHLRARSPFLLIYPSLSPQRDWGLNYSLIPFGVSQAPIHPHQPPLKERFPTPHLGALQLPGDASHDVHCISTPNSDADAPQATAIGGMGISTNQKNPRVRIVFQNDLEKSKTNPRFSAHKLSSENRGGDQEGSAKLPPGHPQAHLQDRAPQVWL